MKLLIIFTSILAFTFTVCAGCKKDATESPSQEIAKISDDIAARFTDTEEEFHEGLISFEENGKFGFKDSLGKVVIKPQFDQVGCFNEGLVSVTIGATRERFLSEDGDSTSVWTGGKMGFVDKTGKIVVKPKYDFCSFFSQGVAAVVKDNKWGYVDRSGHEVIKLQYDQARDFYEAKGYAAVSMNGKWGLIDIKGRIVVPLVHENASSTIDGVAHIFPFDENVICYDVYNDGTIIAETLR